MTINKQFKMKRGYCLTYYAVERLAQLSRETGLGPSDVLEQLIRGVKLVPMPLDAAIGNASSKSR